MIQQEGIPRTSKCKEELTFMRRKEKKTMQGIYSASLEKMKERKTDVRKKE
jgi:hypothetical protein